MPRRFIHIALFLFIVTALSGLWMRAIPFIHIFSLNYEHILHAHSHIAILGWAFFGLFIIFLAIIWPNLQQKRHASMLAYSIFFTSIFMFIAFLYEGYATYSIIFSTLHIFVEFWAAFFIYKQIKLQKSIPQISQLFMKGSLIALIISSIGPFLLGYLGATGLRESMFFDMSIYFFLHFQYNGWLFLFLIGLFIKVLHDKNIELSRTLGKYGFWIYFLSLFPWYVSSILWVDLGGFAKVIATAGSVGQWIGVVIILLSVKKVWQLLRDAFSKIILICIMGTFLLLFLKSTMELGLISAPLSNLVFETRSVIIGYLHLTLLGFVSLFILTQFQMTHLFNCKSSSFTLGISIFLVGFVLNELSLFMMGLLSWLDVFNVPFYHESLFIASMLLSIGIGFLWFSLIEKKTNRKSYLQK